jgi:hypothetical protein
MLKIMFNMSNNMSNIQFRADKFLDAGDQYAKYAKQYAQYAQYAIMISICRICTLHFAGVYQHEPGGLSQDSR